MEQIVKRCKESSKPTLVLQCWYCKRIFKDVPAIQCFTKNKPYQVDPNRQWVEIGMSNMFDCEYRGHCQCCGRD